MATPCSQALPHRAAPWLGHPQPPLPSPPHAPAGYVVYDTTHYALHSGANDPFVTQKLRTSHMDHHYVNDKVSQRGMTPAVCVTSVFASGVPCLRVRWTRTHGCAAWGAGRLCLIAAGQVRSGGSPVPPCPPRPLGPSSSSYIPSLADHYPRSATEFRQCFTTASLAPSAPTWPSSTEPTASTVRGARTCAPARAYMTARHPGTAHHVRAPCPAPPWWVPARASFYLCQRDLTPRSPP